MRDRLLAWALQRPRVLLAPSPRSRDLRRRVEAELDRRGWPHALGPADTDVLLEVGRLAPDLAAAADVLWDQVPRPRARGTLSESDVLRDSLDGLVRDLSSPGGNPEDAGPGSGAAAPPDREEPDEEGDESAQEDHGEHDHHGGDVAGLPMAGTEPDRDGLELDTLRIDLGPFLPGWPVGVIASGHLQGDVLTGIEVSTCAQAAALVVEPAALSRADALDALADILLVAGWPAAARDARRARAAVTEERRDGERLVRRLTSAVRGSRSLRWSLRGLGVVPSTAPWPPTLRGDVWERVLHWCDAAEQKRPEPATSTTSPVGPDAWARILEGAELAGVRLAVASLAPGLVARPERTERQTAVTHG